MLEEERKMVLEMLAQGKISAEQAAELLRALGDSTTSEEISQDLPPEGTVSESMREAVRKAREAAREAGQAAREGARDVARQVAREARREASGFSVDLSGVGTFIDNLVNRIIDVSVPGCRWDDTYDGSFGPGPVVLDLTTNNGCIQVHRWSLSTYRLILHVHASGSDEAEARRRAAESIRLEHGPAGIALQVHQGWVNRVWASVELYLPDGPEYHLKAHTGNGSINLESGRFASARVRTGNGSVEGKAIVGNLDVTTGNGSIRAAAGAAGEWKLGTGNGSIYVDTADLGDTAMEVHANTGAGRISVELPGASTNQGGFGHVNVHISTPNFSQAANRLSVRARTGLGSITVRRGA